MDQKPNVSIKNSTKQSKLLALFALIIAFCLPFILVKSFPNKQKANYETQSVALDREDLVIERQEPPKAGEFKPEVPVKGSRAAAPIIENSKAKLLAKTLKIGSTQSKPLTKPNIKEINTTIKTRARDSLAAVFSRLGLKSQTLQLILRENPKMKVLSRLQPNQSLQFTIKNQILEKMIAPISNRQFIVIRREGNHYRGHIESYKVTSRNQYVTATVRGSLYTTAKRNNLPYKLIQQMTEIFAWEINFAKEVHQGDQITMIYKALLVEDRVIGIGDIVAVSYKNRGKTYQAVLHTNRAGHSDYYSLQGKSLKNAFNRYPLRFSHISSPFTASRHHPLLRYRRPHKGVDLAAPIGTPIIATGNGRIEIIGRQSGYGNMIKIKHNQTYSSIYGHMLRFQKGLYKGSLIKKGQVIGYVGQTGLATGPHCHYEFHVNNQPKNPTTISLPRGDAVPAREMAHFRANTNTLMAQLKSFGSGRYARVDKRNHKVG